MHTMPVRSSTFPGLSRCWKSHRRKRRRECRNSQRSISGSDRSQKIISLFCMPELIMISVFQKIRARWRLVFILLLASFAVFITFGPGSNGKNVLPLSDNPDTLLFPAGFSVPRFSAIEQLRNYPSPRYLPGNGLMRLFNWMDPLFMGGGGQKGITSRQA